MKLCVCPEANRTVRTVFPGEIAGASLKLALSDISCS